MNQRYLTATTAPGAKTRRRVKRLIGGAWRVVKGACAACCGPGKGVTRTLYLKVCPCYTFPDEVYYPITDVGDCALPEGACIFLDMRSVLADAPGENLAARFYEDTYPLTPFMGPAGPTVIVDGVCYRFGSLLEIYADPAMSEAERNATGLALGLTTPGVPIATVDLPEGATLAGGDGTELAVAVGVEGEGGYSACSEEAGCSPWVNTGPAFYRAAVCDGSPMAQDLYVCARAAFLGVMMDGCLCIDFSEGFSAGYVAAAEAAAGLTLHTLTPAWSVTWVYGSGHPNRAPALSCCFCTTGDCLQGQQWTNVWGASKWFALDVCCGKRETLRYGVSFSYKRVLTQDLGGGDVVTQTDTAVVTGLDDRPGGGTIVRLLLSQRVERPAAGTDFTNTSVLSVELGPVCCLLFSGGVVPTAGGLNNDGTTFVDDYDGSTQYWYQRVFGADGTGVVNDAAFNLRTAWGGSPWAAAGLQLAQQGDVSDSYVSPVAIGPGPGDCGTAHFALDETFTTPGGSRSDHCEVSLTVTVVQDQTAPCSYFGPCGSSGWGFVEDPLDMLP